MSQLPYDLCCHKGGSALPGLSTRSGYIVHLQGAVYIVPAISSLLLTSSPGNVRPVGALEAAFQGRRSR